MISGAWAALIVWSKTKQMQRDVYSEFTPKYLEKNGV